MQRFKAHAYTATHYGTVLMAGLSFGCVAGLLAFLYGTNIGPGMAHALGTLGGNAVGLGAAGIAALAFKA